LAQQLLGKTAGEVVTTKIGGNEEDWTLLKLARWVDEN
jgi:transcription elongation GreA/GreB family factor